MHAVIEKETALIMHEIVLIIVPCALWFSLETSVITEKLLIYSCDNNAFLY